MKNKGQNIKHPKLRGEWAELRFMARAAEHGMRVSKPFGDCADYDATVEHGGVFHRVQIKSTQSHQRRSHSYACGIRRTSGKPYTKDQVDFLAAYIIPCDVWYIFPVEAIAGFGDLTLSPHLPKSKHARYKEAWHLLLGGVVGDGVGIASLGSPAEESPAVGGEPSTHPDSTLDVDHPFHYAERRMLEVGDRLRNNPFLKLRR